VKFYIQDIFLKINFKDISTKFVIEYYLKFL